MYDFLFIWYVTGKITIRFSLDMEAKENSLCTVTFGYMQFINKKIKVCKVVDIIENPVFIKHAVSFRLDWPSWKGDKWSNCPWAGAHPAPGHGPRNPFLAQFHAGRNPFGDMCAYLALMAFLWWVWHWSQLLQKSLEHQPCANLS